MFKIPDDRIPDFMAVEIRVDRGGLKKLWNLNRDAYKNISNYQHVLSKLQFIDMFYKSLSEFTIFITVYLS